MTEQEFISSMRVLFRVWKDTPYAYDVLADVVGTIGQECFGMPSRELQKLLAKCRGEPVEHDEPPPAIKLEIDRDLKGALAMGKVWGEVFDNLFAPKR